MTDFGGALLPLPVSHLCYVVEEIPRAVEWWARTLGAGPFLLLEDIQFDTLESPYGAAVWHHSAAFGQWGSIAIELQQIDDVRPDRLATSLRVGSAGPSHVGYMVPDAPERSNGLAAEGMALAVHATFGPGEIFIHEAPELGHGIELHRRCDEVDAMFTRVAELSRSWDGSQPLRPITF